MLKGEGVKINISNKLTVLRIALVPFVLALLSLKGFEFKYLCAGVVFLLASYTDYLDGKLARKKNLITSFGQIMDPMADKILVSSVLISFVGLGLADFLPVAIIVARELVITSVRFLILQNDGRVVSANIFGKLKTISQMLAILSIFSLRAFAELGGGGGIFAGENMRFLSGLSCALIWISAGFSILSGITYVYLNRRSITSSF